MRQSNLAFLFLLIIAVVSLVLITDFSGRDLEKVTSKAVLEQEAFGDEQTPEEIKAAFSQYEKKVHIVELKEPAFFEYSVQSQQSMDRINEQHDMAKQDIAGILGKDEFQTQSGSEDFVLKEYKYIFNGMAVNATLYESLEIESLPYVKKVSPSRIYNITLDDSVPLIKANLTWLLTDEDGRYVTGQNITIAIADTGVDYSHTDFGSCSNDTFLAGNCAKVIGGYDFYNNDNDPMDDKGHGTHVAGIAAGNGTLKGVASDARIVAYKVCSSSGGCPSSDILAAMDDAAANNYSILSMSLGGSGGPDSTLSLAADNAVNAGMVVVISAGNNGPVEGTINSPGASRKAITAGASTKSDGIASFSSRGPTGIGTIKPDVLAPGFSICSAQWNNAWSSYQCYDSEHTAISGTSMAAPHVSGVSALMLQMHKNWTPIDVKMALRNTAEDVGFELTSQGHGRVNALAAVNLSSRPCTAEFYTYNITKEVSGIITLNGTALCDNFINYTISLSTAISASSGNITHFPTEGGGLLNVTNKSFSGEEVKTLYLTIPKLVDIAEAQMSIKGLNNSNTYPYSPRIDVGGDGDLDWEGFSGIRTGESANSYNIQGNESVAQKFNWSGGEVEGISLFLEKSNSGDGILVEIQTDQSGFDRPSGNVEYNKTMPAENISASPGWTLSKTNNLNLSSGIYWLIVKLKTRDAGSYRWYRASTDYPDGRIRFSSDWGATWPSGHLYNDMAFRLIRNFYFNHSETFSYGFASELNNFLEFCPADSAGNCTVPIIINSTNGTLVFSDLFIAYEGSATGTSIWKTLNHSNAQKNESLLFVWDTRSAGEGEHVLRLAVHGQNSTSYDYLIKDVNNYEVTKPDSGILVKDGAGITGRALTENLTFENYTIQYRNVNDASWTLINFSETTITNGTLGFFNSTSLPDGNYTINLTIHIGNSSTPFHKSIVLRVDKMLQDGWPQQLDWTPFTSPKVADVDNDGDLEIIVATSYSPYIYSGDGSMASLNRSVYIFHYNGSIMEGWPQPTSAHVWGKSVTIGDMDNDGDLEIIYLDTDRHTIIVRHHNGSIMDSWPVTISATLLESYPSVYDIDNDGYLEVAFSSGYNLFVYEHNGTLKWKSPDSHLRNTYFTPYPVMGDVDKDGYGEILIASVNTDMLYLYGHNGSVMPNWPYNISGGEVFYTAMADLDGDMDLEIVFYKRGTGLMALHHNSSAVEGWPVGSGGVWITNLAAGDLDGDNILEIIAIPFLFGGQTGANISVYRGNGSDFPNFPVDIPYNEIYHRPTMGDVDGDSKHEMLVSGHQLYGGMGTESRVYSYDLDTGQVTPGYPFNPTVGYPYFNRSRIQESAPLIADLDNDGDAELIALSAYFTDRWPEAVYNGGTLVVWDLNSTYNSSLAEWPQYRGNIQNTNSYADVDFDKVLFRDNCPFKSNPSQQDLDNDSIGDACDSVIGNLTNVNVSFNLNITVDGTENLNNQYNGSRQVRFYDNGTLFVNFSLDFNSSSLNLVNVSIEKGKNGTNNYISIRNLNINGTKTLYLERNNQSSNSVCYLDEKDFLLSTLTANCTKLSCPGTSGNYQCTVTNDTFTVSGFAHSGVMESYTAPSPTPPPSGGGGGTGGGGGVLVPPTQETFEEEEEVAVTEGNVTEEEQEEEPVVEQPKELGKVTEDENYWPWAVMIITLVAVIAVTFFEIRRKIFKNKGDND